MLIAKTFPASFRYCDIHPKVTPKVTVLVLVPAHRIHIRPLKLYPLKHRVEMSVWFVCSNDFRTDREVLPALTVQHCVMNGRENEVRGHRLTEEL